jgi:hypothetical protein
LPATLGTSLETPRESTSNRSAKIRSLIAKDEGRFDRVNGTFLISAFLESKSMMEMSSLY